MEVSSKKSYLFSNCKSNSGIIYFRCDITHQGFIERGDLRCILNSLPIVQTNDKSQPKNYWRNITSSQRER